MKISVVVTTYNRPDALRLVLAGLARQQLNRLIASDIEVIVADDGSRPETAEMVQNLQPDFPFALTHLWQEDIGFRAATSRNKATATAQGQYIIFLDGDCVPSAHFLERHWQLAEPGWFVPGNRILLSEAFTRQVLAPKGGPDILSWGNPEWAKAAAAAHCNKSHPLRYLPLGPLRKLRARKWQLVRTCNLAVWRQDLLSVNGLDETFNGWGHEDADLGVRLIRSGVLVKDGRFAVPVFHLWHKENDRSREAENRRRLEAILASDRIQAELGLSQYRITG